MFPISRFAAIGVTPLNSSSSAIEPCSAVGIFIRPGSMRRASDLRHLVGDMGMWAVVGRDRLRASRCLPGGACGKNRAP